MNLNSLNSIEKLYVTENSELISNVYAMMDLVFNSYELEDWVCKLLT